jgi:DNA-binding NarL/FixJ family response regulator
MAIRLVLADDHQIVLDGLELLLRIEPDFEVVARCTSGAAAIDSVVAQRPDVLVLDLVMPDLDGLGVLRALKERHVATRVVLLTAYHDEATLVQAVALGVAGCVLKEMASRLLIQCIRKVYAGEQWIERRTMARVVEHLVRREAERQRLEHLLTPRERDIVKLAASGARNRAIAERLFISEGTVKIHIHNIYQKLSISSRGELIVLARDHHLA